MASLERTIGHMATPEREFPFRLTLPIHEVSKPGKPGRKVLAVWDNKEAKDITFSDLNAYVRFVCVVRRRLTPTRLVFSATLFDNSGRTPQGICIALLPDLDDVADPTSADDDPSEKGQDSEESDCFDDFSSDEDEDDHSHDDYIGGSNPSNKVCLVQKLRSLALILIFNDLSSVQGLLVRSNAQRARGKVTAKVKASDVRRRSEKPRAHRRYL